MTWTIEETADSVATVRINCDRNIQWEQWLLLSSDRHIDNAKSNLKMQRRHLDQAKERNALVFDMGDMYDAMQGKGDRRSSKSSLRVENKQGDYLGSLVRSHYEFWEPYKDNLALFGKGNHETGVLKNSEFDLTRALVDKLRDNGSKVVCGGYRGWVRLMFTSSGSSRSGFNLHYLHGAGGGGPVTRGVINTNRRAVYLPDADIVVGGHIHESWMLEIPRARLSDCGREFPDSQLHICLPTYKEEYFGTGGEGWHHETEKPPKPLGAWWLRFFWDPAVAKIRFEPMRAK